MNPPSSSFTPYPVPRAGMQGRRCEPARVTGRPVFPGGQTAQRADAERQKSQSHKSGPN
jgi:hypothetical protein